MDKTELLKLEAPKYKTDKLSQMIPDGTTTREVFCSVKNVTRTEWTNAALNGLKAAYCVTVWADEYEGETVVILKGVRYAVYRTYQPNAEDIELYLHQKAGV